MTITEAAIREATLELDELETEIEAAERYRLDKLIQRIRFGARVQDFSYPTDSNGMVKIALDSYFICTGILLVGDQRGAQSTYSMPLGVAIRQSSRMGTEGMIPTFSGAIPSGNIGRSIQDVYSQFIPIEMFEPAYRLDDSPAMFAPNVDYWHVLPAEWTIPKGDTLTFAFYYNLVTGSLELNPPNAVLRGYKVLG